MTDNEYKLKRCPFCGSLEHPPKLVQMGALMYVTCQNLRCGMVGPGGVTAAHAVRLWNRRPFAEAREAAYASLVQRLQGDALAGGLFNGRSGRMATVPHVAQTDSGYQAAAALLLDGQYRLVITNTAFPTAESAEVYLLRFFEAMGAK